MSAGSDGVHSWYPDGVMRVRYHRDDNGLPLRTRLGGPWVWPVSLPDAVGRHDCFRTFPIKGPLYLDGYPISMTVIEWRE